MRSEAYNMDCMDYLRTVPDKYFDLAVVDPPYGDIDGTAGFSCKERFDGGNTLNKHIGKFGGKFKAYKKFEDKAPPEKYFRELERVSKNRIIWGGNYFLLPPTRCFIVWDKMNICEDFSMGMCEYAWTSFNGNPKLFKFAPQGTKQEPRFHPTQKPVGLYASIFRHFAKPGDKILDTHLGSGSSRIAAYDAGLDFVGIEIDEEYFRKQEERFKAHTAQTSIFAGGGRNRTRSFILIDE